MTTDDGRDDLKRSLQASLEFATGSGGWVVEGGGVPSSEEGSEGGGAQTAPSDLPILSSPEGGPLAAIREELGECTRCRLSQGRTHIVFGVGNPDAALLFVGEGPGAEEDKRGEPFVGRAGKLLDRMVAAIGLEQGSGSDSEMIDIDLIAGTELQIDRAEQTWKSRRGFHDDGTVGLFAAIHDHVDAVALCHVQCQRAPTAARFNHRLSRLQFQFPAHMVELGDLCFSQ